MNPQLLFLRPLFQKFPSYLPVNEPMTPCQDFFGGLRRMVLLYSSCAQLRYTSWAQICSAFVFVLNISIAQYVTLYHCVCADMSTLNWTLTSIDFQWVCVQTFTLRWLTTSHNCTTVFVVSCPHWCTDFHTLSLGLCSDVYTEWLLTTSCNFCIIVFVVSCPHWMDTDFHRLSLGLCSDVYTEWLLTASCNYITVLSLWCHVYTQWTLTSIYCPWACVQTFTLSDYWQPRVTMALCLWSHAHIEWTLASTHRHEVCVQKFTQWWLTTWCNYCVTVFVVSCPRWMDTDFHALS